MKLIPLTQGKSAMVSDEDYESLSKFKWYAYKRPESHTYYACRNIRILGRKTTTKMHNQILGISGIDHRDGDGLNNVRENLRIANHSQNMANRRKRKEATSKFKGVSWDKISNKWRVRAGRNVHLGRFESEKSAAIAYNEWAVSQFGDFAQLNEI